MLKKFKKGVKRVMKEVRDYVNESNELGTRVYENTREDLKNLLKSNNRVTAGFIGIGLSIMLLLSGYLENGCVLYKEC